MEYVHTKRANAHSSLFLAKLKSERIIHILFFLICRLLIESKIKHANTLILQNDLRFVFACLFARYTIIVYMTEMAL